MANMRAIDVAPTISYLMRMPEPQNARGKIRLDMLSGTPALVSRHPRHQRLPRPARPAQRGGGQPGRRSAANPVFAIGGSAFLKPWFDAYRAENPGARSGHRGRRGRSDAADLGRLRRQAHDRAHEHDGLHARRARQPQLRPREQYLRNELIPLANFKYVSANIVDPATGKTPAEWAPSRTIDLGDVKLAVIGFSNEDIELAGPGRSVPSS